MQEKSAISTLTPFNNSVPSYITLTCLIFGGSKLFSSVFGIPNLTSLVLALAVILAALLTIGPK